MPKQKLSKPLISKEEFVRLINLLIETRNQFNKLCETMEDLAPGFRVDFFPNCQYETEIIKLLSAELNETDDTIEYFMYDLEAGKAKEAKEGLTVLNKTYDLSTPELLYDALVELNFPDYNK